MTPPLSRGEASQAILCLAWAAVNSRGPEGRAAFSPSDLHQHGSRSISASLVGDPSRCAESRSNHRVVRIAGIVIGDDHALRPFAKSRASALCGQTQALGR